MNNKQFLGRIKAGVGGTLSAGAMALQKNADLLNANRALKAASGPSIMATKIGTATGLGAVAGAGAVGAYAINKARQGLNKDINAQNQSGQAAYDAGIKLIRSKASKATKMKLAS